MSKPHQKNCNDENPCQECQDADRYVDWVKEFGVSAAQEMQKNVKSNKKKFQRRSTVKFDD